MIGVVSHQTSLSSHIPCLQRNHRYSMFRMSLQPTTTTTTINNMVIIEAFFILVYCSPMAHGVMAATPNRRSTINMFSTHSLIIRSVSLMRSTATRSDRFVPKPPHGPVQCLTPPRNSLNQGAQQSLLPLLGLYFLALEARSRYFSYDATKIMNIHTLA